MFFRPEIKEFTKNTLVLTIVLSALLHLTWWYLHKGESPDAKAGNDANFLQANRVYMGNIAAAVGLSIGMGGTAISKTPVALSQDIITISELLAHPVESQKRLISQNMLAINSYANVLGTDIIAMLAQSEDRAATLDEHIDLLKLYGTKTNERLSVIADQLTDLRTHLSSSMATTEWAKSEMEQQYQSMNYSGVDSTIENYVNAKNAENRARVYIVYLERFQSSLQNLQQRNKLIIDTLKMNREALIKNASVVIPSNGSDLVRQLQLLKNESELPATNGNIAN